MPAPPYVAPTAEPHTYTAICRCKAHKYTIELPELNKVMQCNCSICSVYDTFWTFPDPKTIKVEREGPYIEYAWKEGGKLTYKFCATCGNLVKAGMTVGEGMGVNLRLLQDVDGWGMKRDPKVDGAAFPPAYKPAEFKGPAFTGDAGDKTQVYYGQCHCGACTIALRSKPLSEVTINECNCAYCFKDARVHVYPSSDDVHMSGVENLKLFTTDPKSGGGGFFCKTCGVNMVDAEETGAEDAKGNKIPNAKDTLGHDLHIFALNIRTLRDVDWDKLKINKYDGRANDPQFVAD